MIFTLDKSTPVHPFDEAVLIHEDQLVKQLGIMRKAIEDDSLSVQVQPDIYYAFAFVVQKAALGYYSVQKIQVKL